MNFTQEEGKKITDRFSNLEEEIIKIIKSKNVKKFIKLLENEKVEVEKILNEEVESIDIIGLISAVIFRVHEEHNSINFLKKLAKEDKELHWCVVRELRGCFEL